MSQNIQPTKKYGNFIFQRISKIPEIQSTVFELEHLPTGATVMQIANNDDENLFSLSFRTWPQTSNGIAHILEHIVLCGSENFPVRDPFFSMNRRSLNTFMNALTGADFTCYPAASLVEKDFYNLLSVYLDAVFKPNLTKQSFRQEGHRLEFLELENPNSPLLFKGIVFNEMKGALATGEARLSEALMHALFPDLTYGVNSGGDPADIPNLTYEELKAFHETFYDPSRCLFFFSGNFPLEKNLDFLEAHALKGVEKKPPLPLLPTQRRFTKHIEKQLTYPISKEENPKEKVLIGLSWLTCSILEQEELLALSVLEIILMGTDAAPLKKALLQGGVCKQADSTIDHDMSEIPFTIFCKGCSENSANKIENIIRDTLSRLVKEGFVPHLIEGAIHQLEMARSEITGHSSPYGLQLFFRSALLKQHGGNPADGLMIHTLFKNLRQRILNPHYLTGLIEKYFLNNPHFARVEMLPDANLVKQEMEAEQKKLEAICAGLKDPDVKHILDETKKLAEQQNAIENEDLSVLPKVGLEDVASHGKEFPLTQEKIGAFELFYHPCFTNDILYADLIFDLPDILVEDLPLLRLFSIFLPQMGCGGRSYEEHLEYLMAHTGGISASLDLGQQTQNPDLMFPSLCIQTKALYRKADRLFPILSDVISSVNFNDPSRIQELLMQHFHSLENSIQENSLRFAVNLAARGLSVPSTISNLWYGLDYYWHLKKIVEEFEKNPSFLIKKLEEMQEKCLCVEGGQLVLSCEQRIIDELKQKHFYGLTQMTTKPFTRWKGDYSILETTSQGRVTASPVAFTAMLFPSVNYTHPDAPALCVAAEIMQNHVLHKRIREQGGAYGAGAVNGVLSGQFYFYAYRDPQLAKSLEAFYEGVEILANGKFEAAAIEEAQLGLFQDMDGPVPPGSRASIAHGRLRGNRTPEIRQKFREKLLNLSKTDIQTATNNHLVPGLDKKIITCFAGRALLEKENTLLKNKLPIYNLC